MSSIDSYGDLVSDSGDVEATADAIASGDVSPDVAADVINAGGGLALGGVYADPALSTGPYQMQDPLSQLPVLPDLNQGHYPYTANPAAPSGVGVTQPHQRVGAPPPGQWNFPYTANPAAPAVPPPALIQAPGAIATPAPPLAPALGPQTAGTAAPSDPNAAFGAPGAAAPFTLTGPGAQTPFGQVAGQVLGRGYLPAFNFLQLMVDAEQKRLAAEQQKLIDAAAIAAQQGNMTIATQNAEAARAIAGRQQELAESSQRIKQQIDVANAESARNIAGRGMTVEEQNAITQRDIAARGMGLQEKVNPYEATTRRMVGMAPLATSPLVNWYTARGEAPPQVIQDLLRNVALAPGETPAAQPGGTPANAAWYQEPRQSGRMYAAQNPDQMPQGGSPYMPTKTLTPRSGEGPKTSANTPGYLGFQGPPPTDTYAAQNPGQMPQGGFSTGAAPFMRALVSGHRLPDFTGSVGPYAPPLPGGAQWSSMTPGERTGTQELFSSFGIPADDFASMLQKSLPPGGSPQTMANAARFVGAGR